jgi:hypothetical protein
MRDILIVPVILLPTRVKDIIYQNGIEVWNHRPQWKSLIRNTIERSFGLLKMKWHILYKMPSYPMHKQKMIVVDTMVLHNFISELGGEDPDFARFDREPNFVPTIPERFNKYAVPP